MTKNKVSLHERIQVDLSKCFTYQERLLVKVYVDTK